LAFIENVEISALGHGETKEIITKKPTTTEKGFKDIVCTVCDEVLETVEIPMLQAPEFIRGDVDGDGNVNALDLAVMAKEIAGLNSEEEQQYVVNPDVNSDGAVDALDFAILKRIIAGTYNE
jgi:hypothetical protein